MNFHPFNNNDKGVPYINALEMGGHRISKLEDADFALMDFEFSGYILEIKNKNPKIPVFIVPHSGESEVLWDGIYVPHHNTKCNFVFGTGQKSIMETYRYPHPIEILGWPYGEILPIEEGKISKILFAPRHPNKKGRKLLQEDIRENSEVYRKLLAGTSRYQITVRYINDIEQNGLWWDRDVEFQAIKKSSISQAQRAIKDADLVVAIGTFALLALAMGKRVVYFGQNIQPHSMKGFALSWELYKHSRRFPISMEDFPVMSLEDFDNFIGVLENYYFYRLAILWKEHFLGKEWEPGRFVGTIEKYMEER